MRRSLLSWIFITGLYGLAVLSASIFTAKRAGTCRILPYLPLTFTVYHLSYGFGFLAGISRAAMAGIRRGDDLPKAFVNLTR
jgi:hypothetical protein